jgi:hypothetical protein
MPTRKTTVSITPQEKLQVLKSDYANLETSILAEYTKAQAASQKKLDKLSGQLVKLKARLATASERAKSAKAAVKVKKTDAKMIRAEKTKLALSDIKASLLTLKTELAQHKMAHADLVTGQKLFHLKLKGAKAFLDKAMKVKKKAKKKTKKRTVAADAKGDAPIV